LREKQTVTHELLSQARGYIGSTNSQEQEDTSDAIDDS
jgi:hypothetical protein